MYFAPGRHCRLERDAFNSSSQWEAAMPADRQIHDLNFVWGRDSFVASGAAWFLTNLIPFAHLCFTPINEAALKAGYDDISSEQDRKFFCKMQLGLTTDEKASATRKVYRMFKCEFWIRRDSSSVITSSWIPQTLMGIMIILQYWISYNDIGERLSYAATVILTIVGTQTGIKHAAYRGTNSLLDRYDSQVLLFCVVVAAGNVFINTYCLPPCSPDECDFDRTDVKSWM